MVHDQENIVITGTATISSDGSGLLDVTYDINDGKFLIKLDTRNISNVNNMNKLLVIFKLLN